MHLKNEIATIVKEVEVQITTSEDALGKIFALIDKEFEYVPNIETEDCLMQSAFLFDNGKRVIIYTSCHTGISSFECNENWKPYSKPFATMPNGKMMGSYTDYHKRVRKMHGEGKLIKEHSSKL